jgi:hypothetical protein
MKSDLEYYLDYVNNFLTEGGFADYYDLDDATAHDIISKGRAEKIKLDKIADNNYIDSQFERAKRHNSDNNYDMFRHKIKLQFVNGESTNWLSVDNDQLLSIQMILKGEPL